MSCSLSSVKTGWKRQLVQVKNTKPKRTTKRNAFVRWCHSLEKKNPRNTLNNSFEQIKPTWTSKKTSVWEFFLNKWSIDLCETQKTPKLFYNPDNILKLLTRERTGVQGHSLTWTSLSRTCETKHRRAEQCTDCGTICLLGIIKILQLDRMMTPPPPCSTLGMRSLSTVAEGSTCGLGYNCNFYIL